MNSCGFSPVIRRHWHSSYKLFTSNASSSTNQFSHSRLLSHRKRARKYNKQTYLSLIKCFTRTAGRPSSIIVLCPKSIYSTRNLIQFYLSLFITYKINYTPFWNGVGLTNCEYRWRVRAAKIQKSQVSSHNACYIMKLSQTNISKFLILFLAIIIGK